MERKIIWMHLLVIGILSSLNSCNKADVDKVYYERYYLINKSNYNIILKPYYKTGNVDSNIFNLNQGSTISQKLELNFGSATGIIAYADSVLIKFAGSKEINFTPNTQSPYNILDKSNYIVKKDKSGKNREYSYSFTNDDFDNAKLVD